MDDRASLELGFATLSCGARDLREVRRCNVSIDGSHEIISSGLALYIKIQYALDHSAEVISYKVNELYGRYIDPEAIENFIEDDFELTTQVNETGERRISDELWVPDSIYTDIVRMKDEDWATIRVFISLKWHQAPDLDVIEAVLDHFQDNQQADDDGRPFGHVVLPTQGSLIQNLPRTPVTARLGMRRSSFNRAPPLYSPRPTYRGRHQFVQFVHPREVVVGNTHHPSSFREGTCPEPPPYAPPSYADAIADNDGNDRGSESNSRTMAPTTASIVNRRGASIPPIAVSAQQPNFLEAVTGHSTTRQALPDQSRPFDRRYPAWLPKQDYSPMRVVHGYGAPPPPSLRKATFLSFINQAARSITFVEQKEGETDHIRGEDDSDSDEDLPRTPADHEDIMVGISARALARRVAGPDTRSAVRPPAANPNATTTQDDQSGFDRRIRAELRLSMQQLAGIHDNMIYETHVVDDMSRLALQGISDMMHEGEEMLDQMYQTHMRHQTLSHDVVVQSRTFCETVENLSRVRYEARQRDAGLTGVTAFLDVEDAD